LAAIRLFYAQAKTFEIIGEASDGLRAVQLAEQMQPTVVLLDISLPKRNGIEAAGWIRKLVPDTKIVFLSQESDIDIVRAALQLGAWGCVLKANAAQELIAAIHSVSLGKTFVSHSLAGRCFVDELRDSRSD
jgi:DNA-binding NarL/FixJ family response regulator